MIIYGWRSKFGTGADLVGVSCPNCQKPSMRSLTLFKYFHIYWIPIFPYSRKLGTQCTQCNAYYEKETAKEGALQNAFLSVRPASFPLWMFSGGLLLALFIGWIIYDGKEKSDRSAAAMSQPAVGDFFIIKTNEPVLQDDKPFYFRILKATAADDKHLEFDLSEWAFPSLESARKAIDNKTAAISEFDKDAHVNIDRAKFNDPQAMGGTVKQAIRFAP